jgi:hypothetical protein
LIILIIFGQEYKFYTLFTHEIYFIFIMLTANYVYEHLQDLLY